MSPIDDLSQHRLEIISIDSKTLESVRIGSSAVKSYVEDIANGWVIEPCKTLEEVKIPNSKNLFKIFKRSKEAVECARKALLEYQYTLSIHSKNGKTREEFLYDKYNFPPRG